MSKKYSPFLIIAALVLVAAVMVQPDNALASQLLGITITPTQPPPEDTPTPTAEETTPPPEDTPTPTSVKPPPKKTAKPKATELVLLPETGEFPIDPQQGIQWFFVIGLVILIGAIFFRAMKGSKQRE